MYNQRHEDVEKAYDKDTGSEGDSKEAKMEMEGFCPTCGQKMSASNQGGASVGGGT